MNQSRSFFVIKSEGRERKVESWEGENRDYLIEIADKIRSQPSLSRSTRRKFEICFSFVL